jgi:phosphopantothenoylcysteine decarboxylase/phosphopantothenate--cysteine ligase
MSSGRLAGRRVVLGVSGGVAAYKSALLARLLVGEGADVRAVMTDSAARFLGPPTLAALTGHPVVVDLFDDDESVSPHTDLARWADVVVVAPATTATIARLATGMSSDALSATVVASLAPLVVAPAMHTEMWEHPATQRNMETLRTDGVTIVGPASGPLAGGDEGPGRMSEPDEILESVVGSLTGPLTGRVVLVTAGGTREAIDPVRYVGNRSSGKMGHAVAEAAVSAGADVILVTTSHLPSSPRIRRIQVESAHEMDDAVAAETPDVAIMAAAVADFRPAASHGSKLRRSDGPPEIVLEPTPDILANTARRQDRPAVLVGFAAETGSLDRAVEKAKRKGVDFLVANDVSQPDAGFAVDTNRVSIIWPDGRIHPWDLASKADVAARIVELVAGELPERR